VFCSINSLETAFRRWRGEKGEGKEGKGPPGYPGRAFISVIIHPLQLPLSAGVEVDVLSLQGMVTLVSDFRDERFRCLSRPVEHGVVR